MSLQTSGAISFANLRDEYGYPGNSPVHFNAFYRGAYVPIGTAPGNGSFYQDSASYHAPSAIPTGGRMQMSQFYGTSAYVPPVNYAPLNPFPNGLTAHGTSTSSSASVSVSLEADTSLCYVQGDPDGSSESNYWKDTRAPGSDYEVYWTSSGSEVGASTPAGTWHNLQNGWSGGISENAASPTDRTNTFATLNVSIRHVRDYNLGVTFRVTMTADTYVFEN